MRAPEVYPVESLKLGRYAVLGIMALALSLAGVAGGHQLLGAAFGTGDPEEVPAVPAAEVSPCPAAMEAADACDYDGDQAAPKGGGEGCGAVQERGVPATPTEKVGAGAFREGR